MRADRLRLLDALDQIELISRFSQEGRDAFFSDVLIQSAVLHRLALLGEACRGASSALREAHPEAAGTIQEVSPIPPTPNAAPDTVSEIRDPRFCKSLEVAPGCITARCGRST